MSHGLRVGCEAVTFHKITEGVREARGQRGPGPQSSPVAALVSGREGEPTAGWRRCSRVSRGNTETPRWPGAKWRK